MSDTSTGFPWKAVLLGMFTAVIAVAVFVAFSPSADVAPAEADSVADELAAVPEPAASKPRSEATTTAPAPRLQSVAPARSEPSLPIRSDRELQLKLRNERRSYTACYQIGLAHDPDIEGTITVKFRINTDGSVSNPAVVSSTLGSEVAEECLLQVISGWQFRSGMKAQDFQLDFPFTQG